MYGSQPFRRKLRQVKKTSLILLYLLGATVMARGQDSAAAEKKWALNGYVKEMGSIAFDKDFHNAVTNNLVHNRINTIWKPNRTFTAAIEIRNRIYWGDGVRNMPGFGRTLRNKNEWLNLSAVWASGNNFILHSNIDRLWTEYRRSRWNIKLGRQRIKWGITTIWNPNDIFNTYNFLDFDYEERPGTDAAKFQYNINDVSNIDVAISPSDRHKNSIAAARYTINKWGYDLQIVAGKYQDKFTAGFGWAAKLGNLGYRGEGQAFITDKKDSVSIFNYALELDYMFRKNWHVSGSVLHNTNGISEPVNNWSKIDFRFSPVNLMPARWSFITSLSKEFTPSFITRMILLYSPQVNMMIIYPSLTYKLAANLQTDLVCQSFFLELQKRFQATSHNFYIRLKWEFN